MLLLCVSIKIVICINYKKILEAVVRFANAVGSNSISLKRNHSLSVVKDFWDKQIFQDLLQNQPELNSSYDRFWKEYTKDTFVVQLFSEIFEDKILLVNFPAIFVYSEQYKGLSSIRQNTFLYLSEQTNEFMDCFKKFLLSENKNKSDEILYESYFKLLKKNKTKPVEVFQILKDYTPWSDFGELDIKKKLKCYISLGKNKTVYDAIMNDLSKQISNNAEIENYFLNYVDKFSTDLKEHYNNQKVARPKFIIEEDYRYRFELNEDYIIEKTKQNGNQVKEFKIIFSQAFYEILLKEIGLLIKRNSINVTNPENMDVLFKNEDDRQRCKVFSSKISHLLEELITNVDWNKTREEKEFFIKNHFTKYYLKYNLETNLQDKTSSNKSIKI